MDDYSRFVPAVKFELIPIKNLVSNQEYQRALSQKHINRAAANFDVFQINPVKVSRRDGINYVFNGQHTIEIVALVSGSRETPVWCMVYEDLYYEHEADIFANQQKFVKQLSSYEIFVASIEAGNDKEVIIKDLVAICSPPVFLRLYSLHKRFKLGDRRYLRVFAQHLVDVLLVGFIGSTVEDGDDTRIVLATYESSHSLTKLDFIRSANCRSNLLFIWQNNSFQF